MGNDNEEQANDVDWFGFEKYAKVSRRAQVLAGMERVMPRAELCALIQPVSPKGEGGAKSSSRRWEITPGKGHEGHGRQ